MGIAGRSLNCEVVPYRAYRGTLDCPVAAAHVPGVIPSMARRPFDRNQIQSCTATGGGRVEASIVIEPTQVDLARELHQLTLLMSDRTAPGQLASSVSRVQNLIQTRRHTGVALQVGIAHPVMVIDTHGAVPIAILD
jgi:hypothetical protein